MRISVVIPAYNARSYIRETLASVRAQTHPPAEILLVDDGSTDGTAEFVAEHYPEVRVLRQDNQGQSAARNRAVGEATGDVIAFLDADDVWLPDKLARQLAVLQAHPEDVLVYAGWARPGRPAPSPTGKARPLHFLQILYGYFLGPSGVLVRRDAFLAAGGFRRERLGIEDRDLWSRLAQLGTVHMCWDVLWFYRYTPKQHADFRRRHFQRSLDLVQEMQPYVAEQFGQSTWEVLQAAQCYRYRLYFRRDGDLTSVAACEAELARLSPRARRQAYRAIYLPYVFARLWKTLRRHEDFTSEPLPPVSAFRMPS